MLRLRKTFFLLLIVISIATFLRLYHITDTPPGLYPDEAMNGNNALEALRIGFPEGFKVFYTENNGREGLFINIQAFFLWLANANEPWVLRFPSALFGILTVLGIYLLTRELFAGYKIRNGYGITKKETINVSYIPNPLARRSIQRRRQSVFRSEIIALLAAFFLATSFWHINFSRIGFRAIMTPFFLTWALYFFLRALNHTTEKGFWKLEIGNWKFPILSGLFLGLGMHSYIAYRIMPLIFLAFLPSYWREKRFWIVLSVTALASLAAAAPLFLYYFQNPADFLGRTSQVSIFSSSHPLRNLEINIVKTAGMFFFAGDWNWRHNIAGRAQLFWPVGILFVVGMVAGLKSWKEKPKSEIQNQKQYQNSNFKNSDLFRVSSFEFRVLFLWLFLAAIPVVISNEGIPHALRSILMLPPVMIIAAVGGVTLYDYAKNTIQHYAGRKERNTILLRIATAVFLALLLFEGYTSYFLTWGQNPHIRDAFSANYVTLGTVLNELPRETLKYVVVNASGGDVRGIPMPAQTTMFITDTFTSEGQKEKNIYYTTPEQSDTIPQDSLVFFLE